MITMALLLSNSESAYRLPQNRKLTKINVTQFDVIIIPVKARMSSANKAVTCGAPARVLFLSCSLIADLLSASQSSFVAVFTEQFCPQTQVRATFARGHALQE